MLLLLACLSASAAATPLIRTQPQSPRALQHDVYVDSSGRAVLSELIPVVAPAQLERTEATVTVFIEANSGNKLTRRILTRPLGSSNAQGDLMESTLLWTDSANQEEVEWILTSVSGVRVGGHNDTSEVFILASQSPVRYLNDDNGMVSISDQHNGPWKMETASHGRIALVSGQGKLLNEDATAGSSVVMVSASGQSEEAKFDLQMKRAFFDFPSALQPMHGSKVTVYITGVSNHCLMAHNGTVGGGGSRSSNFSEWTLVDAGERDDCDNCVFMQDKDGFFLCDHDGNVGLGHQSCTENEKLWKLDYHVQHASLSIKSMAHRFLEELRFYPHSLNIVSTVLLNASSPPFLTTYRIQMSDILPNPRGDAMFKFHVKHVELLQ